MNSRVLRLALSLLIAALVATGCGGGDESATVTAPETTATTQDTTGDTTQETTTAATEPTAESEPAPAPEAEMRGVTAYEIGDVGHTEDPVTYAQSPPVGGNHNPGWQNCGFYEVELPNEQAVHSLEHGAVWVTYLADAPAADIETLRSQADAESHLLVSPYPDQTSPFVVTAWGRQMDLDSITDPNFGEFLDLYMKDGPTAPEPNVTCASAYGIPPLDVQTING